MPDEVESALPPNRARVGARIVELELPASLAIRLDVVHLLATNATRAQVAALGVCWASSGRPQVRYAACGYSPAVYAERVLDELKGRGERISEILAAGMRALALLIPSVIDGEAVESEAGFSAPTAGASTG